MSAPAKPPRPPPPRPGGAPRPDVPPPSPSAPEPLQVDVAPTPPTSDGLVGGAPAATQISTPAADRLVAAPEVIIAHKFKLVRPLRKGAMGSVWVAQHLDLEIEVAIKLLRSDLVEPTAAADGSSASASVSATRTRFEREAKAAAQLRSATVVRILDYGTDRDTQYMAMELLEGEDLAARLNRVETMTPAELAVILVPVARALQAAHDCGLIHRDLKPGNIFLAKEGDDEVPKILDFGVARSTRPDETAAQEITVDGMVVGTPGYMSPEQAVGRTDIDHRSDLWSLGVIAFRALTGQKPFPGPGAIESILQICHNSIPPPSTIAPALPAEIDEFIERVLQRDRDGRFQTAKEMARALYRFLPRNLSQHPPMDSVADAGALHSAAMLRSKDADQGIGSAPAAAAIELGHGVPIPVIADGESDEGVPERDLVEASSRKRSPSLWAVLIGGTVLLAAALVLGVMALRPPPTPQTQASATSGAVATQTPATSVSVAPDPTQSAAARAEPSAPGEPAPVESSEPGASTTTMHPRPDASASHNRKDAGASHPSKRLGY